MMKDKLSGEDMEQEIKQAFRVFDRNGDGYISKTEFKHCMMHFGEQFTDGEVEEMMAEADANNDGQIDYTEFSDMILKEINDDSTNVAQNASDSLAAAALMHSNQLGSKSGAQYRPKRPL